MTDTPKLLPHDLESERAVLGAILLDSDAYHTAAATLSVSDFYLDAHRAIFAAMTSLVEAGADVDAILVGDALARTEMLDRAGGLAYLAGLTDGLPRATNVVHYSGRVKDRSGLRRLIQLANETMTRAYEGAESAATVIGELEDELLKLGVTTSRSGFRPMTELVPEAYQRAEVRSQHRQQDGPGIHSGLRDLDRITGGFRPGNLVIVAARPGLGKTSLCLNIAAHAALRLRKRVAIFSLEMSEAEVTDRLIYSEGMIDSYKAENGYLSREDWARFSEIAGALNEARIDVDQTGVMTIHELRAKARRRQLERGMDLLVVDYLGLISGSGRRNENRVQEVTEISRGLKQLAKELEVPVIAAAQLNRAVEVRGGARRPMLSDLRDSGSIEADADLVIFIHREEVYNRTPENEGIAELIVGKQRNGSTGDVRVAFMRQFTRFLDLTERAEGGE